MSLIRQIVLLIGSVLILALLGAVSLNVLAARQSLTTQLQLKNADNAAALALALSQHKGDPVAMELLMAAQFDTGHYQRITLVDAAGKPLFRRDSERQALDAPAWFVSLLPIELEAGHAQVSDGWRNIGALTVQSHVAYAHDALWQGALRAAGWLLLVGVLACAVAALGVRAVRRPLDATVAQAAALQEGRFVLVTVPRVPEMRSLARAMNAMVERLRGVFEVQARQVEGLRRLAEVDAMTGLANRRHFIARLDAALQGERGNAAGGLILLRVRQLEELNRRCGRAVADAVLRAVSDRLLSLQSQGQGHFAGRLNGADFALYAGEDVPVDTVAKELETGLRAALPALAEQAAVCIGSCDLAGAPDTAAALVAADDALADAESQGAFGRAHRAARNQAVALRPEADWRARIDVALASGAALLAQYPVRAASGATLHLECPLRLRLAGDAAAAPAAQWLPHALRSGLTPRLDLRALDLALSACASDGQTRSVNIALESLTTAGFVAELRAALLARPDAAERVLMELPERAWVEHPALVRDAVRQWRECGATVGIEHAGEASSQLSQIYDLGLGFVKIDRRHVDGAAQDSQVRQFAASLVTLLHGMGLQVIAEGVRSDEDLQALWSIGFDGATGPAVAA